MVRDELVAAESATEATVRLKSRSDQDSRFSDAVCADAMAARLAHWCADAMAARLAHWWTDGVEEGLMRWGGRSCLAPSSFHQLQRGVRPSRDWPRAFFQARRPQVETSARAVAGLLTGAAQAEPEQMNSAGALVAFHAATAARVGVARRPCPHRCAMQWRRRRCRRGVFRNAAPATPGRSSAGK